jgi:hypothetical protein
MHYAAAMLHLAENVAMQHETEVPELCCSNAAA